MLLLFPGLYFATNLTRLQILSTNIKVANVFLAWTFWGTSLPKALFYDISNI